MQNNSIYYNNFSYILCGKRKVLCLKRDIKTIVLMSILFFFDLIISIYLYHSFLNIYFLIIILLLFILMFANYILSIITEPGIIPRNYKKYVLNTTNETNCFINKTNNIQIKEEKQNINIRESIKNSTSKEMIITNNQNNSNKSLFHNINDKAEDIKKSEGKDKTEIFQSKKQMEIKTIINIMPEFKDEKELTKEERKRKEKEDLNNSLIFQRDFDNDINIDIYKNNFINNKKNNIIDKIEFNYNLPLIFQKRPCYTCNIMRPPKASHCKICDNCILGLDQ